MSGLLSITLHHSFIPGRRSKLPCEGHSYVLGTNGAGKTSALNLIPIFYGKDPATLMVQAADKKNFADYYLPNDQSMIVFEYRRSGGEVCCSVMYRKSDGQYAYRFVEGEADNTLFHPSVEDYYTRGESANDILRQVLPDNGVTVSSQILTVMDYRSIIQNDPHSSGRRRRRNSSPFSRGNDARRFSLGDGIGRIQHIEAMTAVAASKGRLLASLKEMIVDTMLYDSVSIGAPPTHHKNVDLWADLQSLQDFRKSVPQLRQGLQAHYALQDSRTALVAHESAMRRVITANQEKAVKAEQTWQEKADQLSDLDTEYQREYRRLSSEVIEHQQQVDLEERRIQGLEEAREEWQDADIELSQRKVESIPELMTRRDEAEKNLEVMTSAVEHIEKAFAKRKDNAKAAYQAERERLQRRLQSLNDNLLVLVGKQAEELAELQRRHQADIDRMDGEASKRAEVLQSAINALQEERVRSVLPLEEEDAQLEASSEAVEAAQGAVTSAEAHEREARQSRDDWRADRDKALEALRQAENVLLAKKDQRDQLSRQLHPKDGTLLAFLRDSDLPWHDSLGKMIDPRLLDRRDLSPVLAPLPNLEQAFGLTLDLSDVERPAAAEEESVLQARLDKVLDAVRHASDEVGRLELKAKQATDGFKTADQQCQVAVNRLEQAVDKLGQAQASDKDLRYRLQKAQQERAHELERRLKEAQDALGQHHNSAKTHRQQRIEEQNAQRLQRIADQQGDKQELEEEKAAVQDSLKAVSVDEGDALKKLDEWREQMMSEEGVDPKAIRSVSAEVETLLTQIKEAESLRSTVSAFIAWERDQWSQKPGYEAALDIARVKFDHAERARREAKTAFEKSYEALNGERKDAEARAERLRAEMREDTLLADSAYDLVEELPGSDVAQVAPDEVSVNSRDQLKNELGRLVKVAEDQRQTVLKIARRCSSTLAQHPVSKIFQSWQNMRDHRRNTSRHEDGSNPFTLEQMQDLEALLEHHVPDIEKAIIENVHAIGGELSDYHEELKGLDSRTRSITRKLINDLNTDHEFTVISDVSLKVKSKIHTFGFWRDLSDFAVAWAEWATTGFSELPSETLLQRMTTIDSQLKHARVDTHSLSSMVELEIEFLEQGRRVPIRNDNDLNASGSQGISRLAILVLFSALARYLCPDDKVNITWPIDELGELAPENSVKLFRMMDARNISLFCAEPSITVDLLRYFHHQVLLDKHRGVLRMVPKESNTHNPLLASLGTQNGSSENAADDSLSTSQEVANER